MNSTNTQEDVLYKIAHQLDITPSKYKQAMERFKSIKSYLQDGEYGGVIDDLEIYLQGSFKLGTEIRPYRNSEDADYDIDIVCRLGHKKDTSNPKTVKHQVGDHLKDNDTYKKMLAEEGKRCWTLNYAEQDGIGFHMDILPSVKEEKNMYGENDNYSNTIAITNKKKDSYEWLSSNPKGFAQWFYKKNISFESIKQDQKKFLFESHRQEGIFNDLSDVPDIHVKTPLQRAIQLLKRHRDIRFSERENEKCKPISMIITVLAAQLYQKETTIAETLGNLINALSTYAAQINPNFLYDEILAKSNYELITRTKDGRWFIANPTNYNENFADKWHENENGIPHARAKAFFEWVTWLKEDFLNFNESNFEEKYAQALGFATNNSKSIASIQFQALSFNVAHRQKPCWPLDLQYTTTITGNYRVKQEWQKFNSGQGFGKGFKLLFFASTNVPKPFSVYWQIVNTGKEAENAGELRGKIIRSNTAGSGGVIQKEITYYAGSHWVECFIVKDEKCLSRSGEFVVRIV